MEPIWGDDQVWTTSRTYEGRRYLTMAQSGSEQVLLSSFMDDEYTNALHMNRWQTLYLEGILGIHKESIYEQKYFEYRYNNGMISETQEWLTQDQSGTYPLDTSSLGLLTELTYVGNSHITKNLKEPLLNLFLPVKMACPVRCKWRRHDRL